MYSYSQLQSLLNKLSAAHPHVLAIQNDILPAIPDSRLSYQRRTRRQMQITKHPGGTQNILFDSDPAKRINELSTFLKCSKENAAETYKLLQAIYKINPSGAWFVGQAPNTNDHRLDHTAAFTTEHSRAYVKDLLEELSDLLPSITSIKVIRYTEHHRNGSKRTKSMLRFLSGPDTEIAAIDVQIMNLHLRHTISPEDTVYSGLNNHREALLQSQLDVDPQDWPLVLHTLLLFSSTLPLSEVVLRPSKKKAVKN